MKKNILNSFFMLKNSRKIALIFLLPALASCTKISPIFEHEQDKRIISEGEGENLSSLDKLRSLIEGLKNEQDKKDFINLIDERGYYLSKINSYKENLKEKEETVGVKTIYSLNVLKEENRSEAERFSRELFLPYKKVLLNPNYITNANYTNNDIFKNLLSEFNNIVYLFIKIYPDYVLEKQILEKYWGAVVSACDESAPLEISGCEDRLRFFKSDNDSSGILQFYAWNVLDKIKKEQKFLSGCESLEGIDKSRCIKKSEFFNLVRTYYQVVPMLIAMGNRDLNSSVMGGVLYILGGDYFIQYLDSLDTESLDEQGSLLEKFNASVTLSVNVIKENLSSANYQKYAKEIIKDTEFWPNYNKNNKWKNKLYSIAFDRRVLDDMAILESVAKKALHDAGEGGVLRILGDMSFEKKEVLANLGVSGFEIKEYINLYIMNQVYLGIWGMEESSGLWNSLDFSLKEKEEFLKTFKNYIKFRIVEKLMYSIKIISEASFSSQLDEGHISAARRIKIILDKDSILQGEWQKLRTKLGILKSFFRRHFTQDDMKSNLNAQGINIIFESIERNIKLTSVYPLMLNLMYYFVENTSLKVYDSERIRYNSTSIFQRFIEGKGPWFSFGGGTEATQTENFYVIYFLLKTGVLPLMQKIKAEYKNESLGFFKKDMDEGKLFTELFDYALSVERELLTEDEKFLDATVGSNSYASSLKLCDSLTLLTEEEFSKDENIILRDLKDLKETSFLLYEDSYYEPIKAVFIEYAEPMFDRFFVGALGYGRFDSAIKIFLFLDTSLDILKAHWKNKEDRELSEDKKDKLKKEHALYLDEIERVKSEYSKLSNERYKEAISLYKEFKACAYAFYEKDKEQQYLIYDKEASRFLDIHKKLKELNNMVSKIERFDIDTDSVAPGDEDSNSVESMAGTLTKEFQKGAHREILNTDKLYPLYDKIYLNSSGVPVYEMSGWDFFLRVANSIEEINSTIDIKDISQTSLDYNPEFWNAGSEMDTIKYKEDEDEFLKSAMKHISSYVDWNKKDSKQNEKMLEFFKKKISLMIDIYYAEEFNLIPIDTNEGRVVSLEDIFNEIKTILRTIHIDDETPIGELKKTQADYFRIFARDRVYEEGHYPEGVMTSMSERGGIEGLFFMNNADDSLPIYEYIYKKMKDKLAVNILEDFVRPAARIINGMDLSSPSSSTKSNATNILFFLPSEDPVRKLIIDNYKKYVKKGFSVMDKLIDEIKSLGREEARVGGFGKGFADGKGIRYKINPNTKEEKYERSNYIVTNDMSDGAEYIYIRKDTVDEYTDFKEKFYKDTKCIFAEAKEAQKYCGESK